MGTVAVANLTQGVSDNKRYVDADVTMSASYATGGDTVPVATLGLKVVDQILMHGNNDGLSLDLGGTSQAPKLLAYDTDETEVSAATNLSARVLRVRFLGS